ncbi:hypothetical protein [Leptolyngbya sp. GGD]|uniref:hypothetical protein n=1 Tax=Leptolyngbya sp. GGD TaxID=2997907 RepID=UPI00227BCC28|nr:hypothetical protein [Leptolyngbya sp. GGD]MCY6494336.1 hypothetical protein [Leptolyngbya sp. GGD]
MKVKGILRGQTIELLEQVNAPDGTEVSVEVEILSAPHHSPAQPLSDEERLTKLNELFGAWKNQPDLDEIFAEIDRERHAYRGRQIDSFDD